MNKLQDQVHKVWEDVQCERGLLFTPKNTKKFSEVLAARLQKDTWVVILRCSIGMPDAPHRGTSR